MFGERHAIQKRIPIAVSIDKQHYCTTQHHWDPCSTNNDLAVRCLMQMMKQKQKQQEAEQGAGHGGCGRT